ncbi:molecular chaperone TorD family protein [Pelagibius litoralis]|uniref:Molecular chaperone TorD family protein n=1 Tax=Pelagibius litoralis TaxID=374515 RepID=A0A967EY57_9PROT|nr:molecular chaperone TorD family protein [Pelagibius litoralis]NIA69515.1 molecular chaperone TorD family protein [Pelagibius litoralis]
MAAQIPIAEEDQLRAGWYALLAQLLSGEPGEPALRMMRGLSGDDSELGQAIKALAAAAKGTTVDAARQEYFDLFVGLGQGELLPYASYYLTGFLNEKPLARLRGDMARLQIARADDVSEPEDHVAALCEMMAGLITGSFGDPAGLAEQRKFFDTHIGCWAPRFFEDLQAAQAAVLYMPVGTIGRLFMEIESQAFEMAA